MHVNRLQRVVSVDDVQNQLVSDVFRPDLVNQRIDIVYLVNFVVRARDLVQGALTKSQKVNLLFRVQRKRRFKSVLKLLVHERVRRNARVVQLVYSPDLIRVFVLGCLRLRVVLVELVVKIRHQVVRALRHRDLRLLQLFQRNRLFRLVSLSVC